MTGSSFTTGNPYLIATLMGLLVAFGCRKDKSIIPEVDQEAFQQYWFQGKAEINNYTLSQSRYGAQHEGTAVLVFVTEDFSKSRHVKLEDRQKHKSDAVPVMKLNFMKTFVTGLYEYRLMNSVFTPLDSRQYPHSFKLTSGAQDWCGQGFLQYNWKGNRYDVQDFSYFENEGDRTYSLANGWLENEIWTHIRTAPQMLPVGKVKWIPGAFYVRLQHIENKVYDAVTELLRNGPMYTYTIRYPDLNRSLSIQFEADFPHRIMSWTEDNGPGDVTTGHWKHTLLSDYWQHHFPVDTSMRVPLQLEE